MANYKTGAQRYNDRMDRIFSNAKNLEKKRLSEGKKPNPSLTSPEEALKHGWIIKGRDVKKREIAKKMHHKGTKYLPLHPIHEEEVRRGIRKEE